MSRRAGVAAATCLALVSSTFVASAVLAPSAFADIGDKTKFALPIAAEGITLTASGDFWLTPEKGKSLLSVTPTGAVTSHPIQSQDFAGGEITQDAAGRIWFTELTYDSLTSVDATGGDWRQYFLAVKDPYFIAAGSDGSIWIASLNTIGRLNPDHSGKTFAPLGKVGGLAAGPDNLVIQSNQATLNLGKIAAATNTVSPIPVPDTTRDVAVAPDGTIWARGSTSIIRVGPAGDVAVFSGTGNSTARGLALAPDGSTWFSDGANSIGRIAPNGKMTKFAYDGGFPSDMALGADGNVWVVGEKSLTRVLTGVTPLSAAAPAVSGSANSAGAVLSADNGKWKYLPTSFDQQWQRCAANDPASCTDIDGATKANYTIADADIGGWLRVNVTAKNLNGASKPAGSALFQAAPKATAPTQPTNPTAPAPVTGVGKVTIAAGVTAALGGPSSVKRKAKKTYRVAFNAPQPRGTVKLSLVNAAGAEAFVITAGAKVKGTKKIAFATKTARIPKAVPKGAYTLVAVYTPAATQAGTYAVATITKPLTLR